ncbi:hypothetical protein P171DRAFT_487960 [Karstenula rhodostoma CBS 690.94]|uniref:Uncharacterized protein n=1 Tax=Karstenula rhodostoma CBS 690.94 TaxID=1392251 RepID=A0A9P4U8S6_9PLEO|nr:hypothetical protein P171DRAFT_487960 [Karstenula rhodostoma CBS 690.94]
MEPSRKRGRDANDRSSYYARRRQDMLDVRKCVKELQTADDGTIYKIIERWADADDTVAMDLHKAYGTLQARQQEHGINFDHHIKAVLYKLHKDDLWPQRPKHEAAAEVPAFIEKTIETIGRKATRHSSYETKLAGLRTLLQIGKIICGCVNEGVEQAVRQHFQKEATLGDAMYNIAESMGQSQLGGLCSEVNGEPTFLENMEGLVALEEETQMEMGLAEVLNLFTDTEDATEGEDESEDGDGEDAGEGDNEDRDEDENGDGQDEDEEEDDSDSEGFDSDGVVKAPRREVRNRRSRRTVVPSNSSKGKYTSLPWLGNMF